MVQFTLSAEMGFCYEDDEVEGMTDIEIINMAKEEFMEFIGNVDIEVSDYDDDREDDEDEDFD